jgi:cell division protein FtsB
VKLPHSLKLQRPVRLLHRRKPTGSPPQPKRAGAGRSARAKDPDRKTSFTGRAAILAVVLAALAIALAAPLRQLISQRAQLSSLRDSVATQQQQLKDLQRTQKLWTDPAYVAAQARQRLHYARPGQIPFVTLSPTPTASSSAAAGAPAPDEPWYAQLWSSVQRAAATPHAMPHATPTTHATPTPYAGLASQLGP